MDGVSGENASPPLTGGMAMACCPRLNYPSPDCYCVNITSLKIPLALEFCAKDFVKCEIYLRYRQGHSTVGGNGGK